MFDKYKNTCNFCNNNYFTFTMLKKENCYICNKCYNLLKSYNNNYLAPYTIEELKMSISMKESVDNIRVKQKRAEHIKERQRLYIETLSSINIKIPEVSQCKTKKKYLKDIPDFNYSSIRKNIPQNKLENFVVIDTETTGLRPASDEIIEISAIKFINAEPVECLTTLIKPKKEIPENISRINHITNEMVANSPCIENVINSFSEFIKGYNVVGYNLDFDLRFLHVNGMDFFSEKRQFYDALEIARKVYKYKLDNFKLDTVANEMELFRTQAHRATEDAFVTGIIFRDLGNYLKSH